MTITFPRDLPAGVKFETGHFELRYQQLTELAAGGMPQVVNVGADLWRATYRTVPLTEEAGEGMAAWLSSLRGGMKLFRATNPLRKFPIKYRAGFTGMVKAATAIAFTGQPTIAAITTLRDGLTLSGLPASFVLVPGDWITIPVSASRVSLHRILEGATASGTGIASVLVEPAILPDAAVGASAVLASPYMHAVLDASGLKASPARRGRFYVYEFPANQVLG